MSEHNRCLSTRRAGLPVTATTLSSLELVQVAGDMDQEHVDTRVRSINSASRKGSERT